MQGEPPWLFPGSSVLMIILLQILIPNPTFLPSLHGAGLAACPVTEGEESNSELHLSNFCSYGFSAV